MVDYFKVAEELEDKRLFSKAIQYYLMAIKADANDVDAKLNLGNIFDHFGQKDKALALYNSVIQIEPTSTRAHYYRAVSFHFESTEQKEFQQLMSLAKQPDHRFWNKVRLHFALGKACHDLKDYKGSFGHYATGNAMAWAELDFEFKAYRDELQKELDFFVREKAIQAKTGGGDGRLVFVIGLPRSGKSLVERVLSHGDERFFAADETSIISRFSDRIAKTLLSKESYPFCLKGADQSQLDELSQELLKKFSRFNGPQVSHIIDTSPNNHRFLGLIRCLLPNAKIICCQRGTMDHALYLYFNYFSRRMTYSYDLVNIGHYLNYFYDEMNQWKTKLGLKPTEVVYEDMVKDPQGHRDRLLKAIGLEKSETTLPPVSDDEVGQAQNFSENLTLLREITK